MTASSFHANIGPTIDNQARKTGRVALMLASMAAMIPWSFRRSSARAPREPIYDASGKRRPRDLNLRLGHVSPSYRYSVQYPENWGTRHNRRWRHKSIVSLSA